MIVVEHLHKRYGKRTAVEDVSFTAQRGAVTGLIGPNGAGKSTTLRMILGLTKPTSGYAAIGGVPYPEIANPLLRVGAVLDNVSPVPERRVINHLRWIARSNGIPLTRLRTVLEIVGLGDEARTRAGRCSLGMRQRVGIAAALLGDPDVLLLDEPMNGLDPEAIRWLRGLLSSRAAAGGTIIVSSHFMRELETVADDVVLISNGRVLAQARLVDLVAEHGSLEAAYFNTTEDAA